MSDIMTGPVGAGGFAVKKCVISNLFHSLKIRKTIQDTRLQNFNQRVIQQRQVQFDYRIIHVTTFNL